MFLQQTLKENVSFKPRISFLPRSTVQIFNSPPNRPISTSALAAALTFQGLPFVCESRLQTYRLTPVSKLSFEPVEEDEEECRRPSSFASAGSSAWVFPLRASEHSDISLECPVETPDT